MVPDYPVQHVQKRHGFNYSPIHIDAELLASWEGTPFVVLCCLYEEDALQPQ